MSEESAESRQTAAAAADDGESNDVGTNAADDGDQPTDGDSAHADVDGGPDDPDGEPAGTDGDAPTLAERVEEYDEDLAEDVAGMESRLATVESELEEKVDRIDELEGALRRSQADFKNYKKRAKRREEEIKERATEDFVGRIVSVRDNLVRALDQDEGADIRPGIESTVEEFDRILAEENVSEIDPEVGAAVDPTRHEVLMRVDAEQPEGTVAEVYQPGYEMAGTVLREAQVTVSEGGSDGDDGPDTDPDDTE
jgi:molecular chaperone GrpE